MFQRLPDTAATTEVITVEVNGRSVRVRPGDSAAAAMLLAGIGWSRRTPISGAPRAPYCMMGVCFECLVEIDGRGSQPACLVRVRPGMRIERQLDRPELA